MLFRMRDVSAAEEITSAAEDLANFLTMTLILSLTPIDPHDT